MPGDPSPPRRPRINLLAAAAALFTLLFLASLRFAAVVSLTDHAATGIMAGGLWFQLRNPPPAPAFPASRPMRPPPVIKHDPLYVYRHGFSFQWWFEHSALPIPGLSQSWSAPL